MKTLTEYITDHVSMDDHELIDIVSAFTSKTIKKNSCLLKAGQYCDHYFFVEEGACKIFTNIDERDITSWFAFEGYFFTELESYSSKTISRFTIQATETSSILVISRKAMDSFIIQYPKWNEFVRKVWEFSFVKLQQVVLSFQTQTAEERYEDLFKYPDFIQRTRQEDLASMLGITKYSLSRLRRKK